MDDELEVRVEDLNVYAIQDLLAEQGQHVTLEQAQMIANFVHEAGGLDEALDVLSELRRDRSAA